MSSRKYVVVSLIVSLGAAIGCQSTGLRLLNVIGVSKRPVVIGLASQNDVTHVGNALNPFPAHEEFRKALGERIGRPVAIEPCFAFQVPGLLKDNWYNLAVISPAHYARYNDPVSFPILVLPADENGRIVRAAVLVTAANSPIQKPGDLRSKSVGFGPAEDSLTHYAALELLWEYNIQRSDLALEVLPVPGSLRHFDSGRDVAKSILGGGVAAGFMDERDWEALPETAGDEAEPSRSKLRILGKTASYPIRLFTYSPALDEETREAVRSALLRMHETDPNSLRPLGYSKFLATDPNAVDACLHLRRAISTDAPAASQPAAQK